MRTSLLRESVARCAHPLALACALTLLLNALALQPLAPGWVSGKLGGLAWLALAPLALAIPLALLRAAPDMRRLALAATSLAGGAFALAKLSPAANALAAAAYRALTGLDAKLTLDPSDLLALPGLALGWWLLARAPAAAPSRRRQALALGLVGLALAADAPGPQDLGVVCLHVGNAGGVVAGRQIDSRSYFSSSTTYRYFHSADNGATWQPASVAPDVRPCTLPQRGDTWSFTDRSAGGVEYMLRSGHGIYRSEDGGATLVRELQISTPLYDVFFDERSGYLLVAAGRAGVAVRSPDGAWSVVPVGP